MIRRLLLFSVLPGWAVVLLLLTGGCGAIATGVLLVVGMTVSAVAGDVEYNCVKLGVGPTETTDPTDTTASMSTTSKPSTVTPIPAVNPYADLPVDSSMSEWQRRCAEAMRKAPYQGPEIAEVNTGFAAMCAGYLAEARIGRAVRNPSEMIRDVVYQASGAALTGTCPQADTPTTTETPAAEATSAPIPGVGSCDHTVAQPDRRPGIVNLPRTLADQGLCGQPVQSRGISPGDLLFWDNQADAPTRAGIAVGSGRMVTSDPVSGRFVEQQVPAATDLRIRRVLPE